MVVLTAFLAVSVLHAACALFDGPAAARLALSVAGGALALLTMAYTGLLLGAVRPIPFWTTPVLPLLFVVSSLSTGAMAADLVAAIAGRSGRALAALRAADLGLLAIEAGVLALYLGLGHATVASRAATALVVRGALAGRFWGGVVAAGPARRGERGASGLRGVAGALERRRARGRMPPPSDRDRRRGEEPAQCGRDALHAPRAAARLAGVRPATGHR